MADDEMTREDVNAKSGEIWTCGTSHSIQCPKCNAGLCLSGTSLFVIPPHGRQKLTCCACGYTADAEYEIKIRWLAPAKS